MADDKKPTIAELEAILDGNDDLEIQIKPDGSITAVAKPPAKLADILPFVRRGPTHY